MKISSAKIFVLCSFWLTLSSASSHEDFLQCLTRFSPNSNSITKQIYTPQNSSYNSVLESSINNLRFAGSSTPKPLVIVTPTEDSQVQTVIYCAKKHDIQMRIRGGGHDYEGLSYVSKAPFVVLDMVHYNKINVDHEAATAWVQSGATLGELYYSIAQKTFRLDRTIEQNGTEILHKWQSVAPKLPKDVEIRVLAATIWKNRPNPGARTVLTDDSVARNRAEKTIRLRFSGYFLGGQDKLVSMMNKEFSELGLTKEHCAELSYIQSALRFSLFSTSESPEVLLNRTSFKIPFKAKSSYAERPISRKGLDGIWTRLLEYDPGTTNFVFTSYGGRMDEIAESAIPFPHRAGTLFMIYMRVQTDGDAEKKIEWIRELYEYLTPYVTQNPRTSYVNYNDLDLGINNEEGPTSYKRASLWGKKYFKNNFDRLVRVKSSVDPGNFFRHEQSIPPSS
ncbi:hypothetical protein ACET3Z_031829 [Daucus carota]